MDCGFFIEESIDPELDDTYISHAMGFYFDSEDNWVQFNIRTDFVKSPDQMFASGTVLTKFGIQNLKSFEDKDGDIIWPPNSLETMFGIAFSHMRAIIAKNVAGTRFSSYIIPLVDPATLFLQLIEQNPSYTIEKTSAKGTDTIKKIKEKEPIQEK